MAAAGVLVAHRSGFAAPNVFHIEASSDGALEIANAFYKSCNPTHDGHH